MTNDGPITLVARWKTNPIHTPTVEALLAELRRASRLEAGCVRYESYREKGDPGTYVLIESYRDESALEAHRASDHFRRIVLELAVPLLVERTVSRLEIFETSQ